MRVDPKDGVCRSCGGELTIIDADDATMTVESEHGRGDEKSPEQQTLF